MATEARNRTTPKGKRENEVVYGLRRLVTEVGYCMRVLARANCYSVRFSEWTFKTLTYLLPSLMLSSDKYNEPQFCGIFSGPLYKKINWIVFPQKRCRIYLGRQYFVAAHAAEQNRSLTKAVDSKISPMGQWTINPARQLWTKAHWSLFTAFYATGNAVLIIKRKRLIQ